MTESEKHDSKQVSLDDLLVDEDEVNQQLLAETLIDYARIGKQSGEVILQPEFEELNAKQKITVLLLAQKARHELGEAETDWLAPSDVREMCSLSKGTTNPAMRELDNQGLVENEDGEYRVPGYKLDVAKNYIKE